MFNEFPNRISDHVKLNWLKNIGTVEILLDNYPLPLLDLRLFKYNSHYHIEEARRYVGIQICDYLKNCKTRSDILRDFWTNQYISQNEMEKMFFAVRAHVREVLKNEP